MLRKEVTETVNHRMTDNTIAKTRRTKRQTMIYKAILTETKD
jgi:hypothetical protein